MPGQSPGPLTREMSEGLGAKGFCGSDCGSVEERGLDHQLWQACAGSMVQLPTGGSKVVYFPQGHGEQAASAPDFPRSLGPSGIVPCRVLSVKFLADKETDEVYTKITLQPEATFAGEADENDSSPTPAEKPASFAKTLTQSDANNGGGFSVPRYCAETIFPKLDYSVDPPVQTVLAKDVHGELWKFRHIYRGTPRRHLLTTGWSTFVNQKKLVAGDAIVFLRTNSGELCVGVRRSMRGAGNADALLWHSANSVGLRSSRWEVRTPESNYAEALGEAASNGAPRSASGGSSFARNRSRVTAKSVLEAATLAAAGKPFEVVYYPRASTAEFCVRAHAVKTALSHAWYPGMRFKMAFETEDSSRISWFMGTICAVQPADPVLWPNSPWRVLQVAWDEPDLLQGVSRVSPWQVELVSTLPMQLPPFSLPKKKLRASQPLTPEGQNFTGLPTTTLASGVLGQMNPWHGLSDDIPAGMQGARHERLYGLTYSDCQPNKIQAGLSDKFHPQEPTAMLNCGATDLRLGNFFLYDRGGAQKNLSSLTTLGNSSQNDSSVNTPSWTGSSNNKQGTILLFGTTINTSKVPEQQNSAGSSSEATSRQSFQNNTSQQLSASSSGESQNDTFERVQRYVTQGSSSGGGESNIQVHQYKNGDSSNGNDIGGLKWFKKQASVLSSERKNTSEGRGGDVQCKIFLESEEVGRTLDLSMFSSYEELYNQLARMFSIDKPKLSGRVVYNDLEGSTIHVGGEPYKSFMTSARRLTILADPRMQNSW